MSVALDPIVAGKLKHFSRRRLRMIVARGICAGVVSLLLLMAAVAFADWYWLLTDNVRWGLSLLAYAGAGLAVWYTSVRRLLHIPAREEIAAQVELAEPELRENLLSAVELATDNPDSIHDSPVFRGLLQGRVAGQMGKLRVPKLLPFRLVGKWVLAALVIAGVVAFLLTAGDPRFRQLATRAMLPGANIARVSRIHVEILKPTPHSLTLAEDETVAVLAEVTGGSVNEVTLETFTESLGSVRHIMRPGDSRQFVANIHVAEESVEYRILAGDAITQRFRIEARPRPRVTVFHKTYTFPEYAQLPSKTVTEDHGDLLILEGTQTDLLLEINQDVAEAELQLDVDGVEELVTIPLTPVDASETNANGGNSPTTLWRATVPVDKAAIYKVHLVSSETGFENKFSPRYEIRPQADLIPKAGFVDQQESTLLLPPNDILALKAMAEDDLPLDKLEQHISVNGQEWLSLPLNPESTDKSGRYLAAEWSWDLLDHQLKPGDQVTTKLVATDRKGNTGDSIPLRIIVAAADFDPQRHVTMERKLGIYDQIQSFADSVGEQKDTAFEIIERLLKPETTAEQKKLDHTALLDLGAKQRELAAELLQQIREVAAEMPAGADAYDLDLAGRVVAKIQREYASSAAARLRSAELADEEKHIQTELNHLKHAFGRAADDAKNVAYHYQHLMSHNFLVAVASDMAALLRQQKLVVDSPTQSWERLLRQETVALEQLNVLRETIENQEVRLPSGLHGHIRSLRSWINAHHDRLSAGTESEDKLPQLQQAAQAFYRELQQRQKYDSIDGGLPGRLIAARRDLSNRSGSLHIPIERLAHVTREENRLAARAMTSDDSNDSQALQNKAGQFAAEVDLQYRPSLEQLRSRRELTRARQDADTQYAADAGLTHRATTALLNRHRTESPTESTIPDNLQEIAPAYRTLEAGHDLIAARDALNVLLNLERWQSQRTSSLTDHPRQWDVVSQTLELALQRMREAQIDNEVISKLQQVQASQAMRDAAKRITERRWKRDRIVGAGHELTEIRAEVAAVVQELSPTMAEARAIIAKYAPTIPELAKQTAEQIRELEDATTETADATEQQPDSAQLPEQLADLEQQQQAVNEQISDLIEALVEDADTQNLLEQEELDRARDADDSIAMLQQPTSQMNQAMQEAQQSDSGTEQAKELSEAAEAQERTAQALDLIAKHFEKLDEGMDVADTRAELRQSEQQQGIAEQMDQQFSESQQLAELARQDTKALMEELEAELQRNPAMQQALSEISQNALQDARNALEDAAEQEDQLQLTNENSDTEFLQQKKDLAEDLREIAQQAQELSNTVLAQADQSAAIGKTPEAQKKFSETRQKLNQAAAKANTARENQSLEQLAQTAQETQQAINEAAETLNQAKQETTTGKDEKIHADDKTRLAQKQEAEKRRNQLIDQQKKSATAATKRATDDKKRADQQVRNAERQLQNAERAVQQAQRNLDRDPDNAGLQANLAREQARAEAEKQKMETAKGQQQEAADTVEQARQNAEEIAGKPTPPLDAANPSTELADQLAQEAIENTKELTERADEIASRSQFGEQLTPSQGQLASATRQQQNITEDLQQAAEDVARAARHERRLNNEQTAEPLRQISQEMQQAASNESKTAEQQLTEATGEAEQNAQNAAQEQASDNSDQNGKPQNQPGNSNQQALEAQQALADAEATFSQQAEQLSSVLEPLLAAAEAELNGESGQQQPGQQQPGQQQPGQQQPGQQQPGQQQPGQQQPGQQQPGQQQPLTSAQIAQGEQLARTLDELDRQMAAAEAALAQSDAGHLTPATAPLDTLAQAAQAQQAAFSARRAEAQQQMAMAMSTNGSESSAAPSATSPPEGFEIRTVDRGDGEDWGSLRKKSAEDTIRGKSEEVSAEYRKSVEAYFRVLAERARDKK